jgi:hypothetical protein
MKKILVVVLLAQAQFAFAQKVSIKGQLADSLGTLPSATILLLQQKDSSLVQFGVSNSDGLFEIKNIGRGDYLFKVTFVGYSNYVQKISVRPENGTVIDLGKIRMRPKSKQLNEVVVKGEKDPVVVKRDTIEFNASSFKTKANANVEDLLKKIPSIEVDNDGNITAQGEQVQKVMVDGKEFFGQDPKLATRNLPADAVDKVQVYDKKSDQTVFSGIDDGQRQKTINLALKEEKRHAYFGNDMVAGGSDLTSGKNSGRYQASAGLNRFEKGNQLSFLGMGNNVNQQGFSFADYANFSGASTGGGGNGGGQQGTGQQNGIVTNYAGGINMNQTVNNLKTKINGSYFYNRLDQNLSTTTHRINYLPPNDSSTTNTYNFDQLTQQHSTADNHRGTLIIDHKIDSVNSLKFTSNLTYTLSGQTLNSDGKTMNIGNASLKNENQSLTTSKGNNTALTSALLLRHKFARKGRTISANLSFNYTENDTRGTLNSLITVYKDALKNETTTTQRNFQNTSSPTYGVTLSYTEPLGNRRYLELNYNFTTDINHVDKEVYDQAVNGETLNANLTNKYNSNYLYNRSGFNFRINREKFNFSIGAGFQQTHLNGNLILKNITIDRQFQMIQPAVHFNYDFTNFKRLRFDYTSNLQEPSVSQLQPIINNTDQLNLSQGNPQLKPAYSHAIRSNFTFFDPANFMNVFALISANYSADAITSAQSINTQTLARTTMPVNVKNSASINSNFNVGIPVKKLNSRFNIGPNYSVSRNYNALSGDDFATLNETEIIQQTAGETTRYNYTLGDILILDLSANLSYQETKYSFNAQQTSANSQNQYYLNKTYNAEVNVNFLKAYAFNTEMNYFIYNSTTTNFHQTIPLWKMSVSRYILKGKSGELKLSVNNLLNYGVSITQTASSNYLQQQTTNNLGRYFLISFTYALNKQLNPMGAGDRRRGGGQRMMFRQ